MGATGTGTTSPWFFPRLAALALPYAGPVQDRLAAGFRQPPPQPLSCPGYGRGFFHFTGPDPIEPSSNHRQPILDQPRISASPLGLLIRPSIQPVTIKAVSWSAFNKHRHPPDRLVGSPDLSG